MTTPELAIRAALDDIATLPVHTERLADRHTITDATGMWIADARSGTAGALCTVLNHLPDFLAAHTRANLARREALIKASDRAGELFRARRRIEQLEQDLAHANAQIATLKAQGGHA